MPALIAKNVRNTEIAESIKQRLGCSAAEVLQIVVGCRGAIPGNTKENLRKLGLKMHDLITISIIALRSSIEIANAFIDYDRLA